MSLRSPVSFEGQFPAILSDSVSIVSIAISSLPESLTAETLKTLPVSLPPHLSRAAEKRKREFLAGRICVREAFLKAGLKTPPEVPFGADRAPRWPEGWVGSITHASKRVSAASSEWAGVATAAVARTNDLRGLGIDSEKVMSEETAAEVREKLLTPSELATGWGRSARQVTLVFSAKESLFKCLHPRVRTFFGFDAAELTYFDPVNGGFKIRLISALNEDFPEGWEIEGVSAEIGDWIHTSIEYRE